jgi:hypothetical protein
MSPAFLTLILSSWLCAIIVLAVRDNRPAQGLLRFGNGPARYGKLSIIPENESRTAATLRALFGPARGGTIRTQTNCGRRLGDVA